MKGLRYTPIITGIYQIWNGWAFKMQLLKQITNNIIADKHNSRLTTIIVINTKYSSLCDACQHDSHSALLGRFRRFGNGRGVPNAWFNVTDCNLRICDPCGVFHTGNVTLKTLSKSSRRFYINKRSRKANFTYYKAKQL